MLFRYSHLETDAFSDNLFYYGNHPKCDFSLVWRGKWIFVTFQNTYRKRQTASMLQMIRIFGTLHYTFTKTLNIAKSYHRKFGLWKLYCFWDFLLFAWKPSQSKQNFHWIGILSCHQTALWMVQSVILSVRHTFFIMFPWSCHHEIFSYYHWQERCPCKRSRSEVKGQSQTCQNPI